MHDQIPPVGATYRRQWIKPPNLPDASTLEASLARLQSSPRIIEAWVVGSRMTRTDEAAPPYETTDIALVLDPPITSSDEDDQASIELIADLRDVSRSIEGRRGFLFVSESQIWAHAEQATLLYSRSP